MIKMLLFGLLAFLARLLVGAMGLYLAASIVPGIQVDTYETYMAAALLLGIVNAFVRPVVVFLTLPATLLSFGLFLLVINGGMFALVAWLLPGFQLSGFWPAFLGALVVSVTGMFASRFLVPRRK